MQTPSSPERDLLLPDASLSAQALAPDPLLQHDIPSQEEVDASLSAGLGFSSLTVQHGIAATDPLLPDLHTPDTSAIIARTESNEGDERPGDLDPSALDTLHATASYQQVAQLHYPSVWMDQGGMNSARARHLTLLDDGLTA